MELLEPILEDDEIQGNILAGFNKPFQSLISLSFGGAVSQTKSWLSQLHITSLSDVLDFRKEFREFKKFDLLENNLAPKSVWLNIAFTYKGLIKLTSTADEFTDNLYKSGLGVASARLKDPTEENHPGNQKNWLFGGIGNEPDALVIIGADNEPDLQNATNTLQAQNKTFQIKCSHIDIGRDLGVYGEDFEEKERLRATEHFGFKDGVSQPGIRGKLKSNNYFLTPRELPVPSDELEIAFSKAGQPLVCPGEYVLGYPRQSDTAGQLAAESYPIGKQANAIAPEWAKNGSFLVYRRLRQDVNAFKSFLKKQCQKLEAQGCPITEKHLNSLIVGRWPNGAPVMEFPEEPEKYEGKGAIQEGFKYEDDAFGKICPASAHIRKVNPRGLSTEQGQPQRTLVHRTLRRGIPFGSPYKDNENFEPAMVDRGLLFVTYQSSIFEQFEFLQRNWANDDQKPHFAKTGHDLIIGQTLKKKENRDRLFYFTFKGQTFSVDTTEEIIKDWVIPTGGGYFFSPSISAIKNVLAK